MGVSKSERVVRAQGDWYDTPLYYDIIFDTLTHQEAAFLEAMWERHGSGQGRGKLRVLEAACGSGRLMGEMLRRGWRVDGFDLNPSMLDHAAARLRKIGGRGGWRLWRADMAGFETPPGRSYHLVHCLVSTFKYLLTEEDAAAALRRMAAALKPGGLLVLGLHLTDYSRTGCEHERWVEERDGVRVQCNIRTWPPDRRARLERIRARLRVTENGETHEQETNWQFRTYSARQLRALLRSVPELKLAACHDFHYDPDSCRKLDKNAADIVLVLSRMGDCG